MAGQQNSSRLSAQVDRWRKELIDLSKRNRLINLPLKGRTTAIEIVEPDFNEVLLGLVNGPGWRFHYPTLDHEEAKLDEAVIRALEAEDPDLTDEVMEDELVTSMPSASKLSTRLRTMSSKSSSEYLDRGLRVLYLAVGMLDWSDGDGSTLLSPLLLVPVSLDRESPRDPFRLVLADDDWQVNPALAVKLNEEFGIELPPMDEGVEVESYLASIANAVKRQGWSVTEQVVLSTLSFAKETMYRDLLDNEAAIIDHPLVQSLALGDHFTEGSRIDRIDPDAMDLSHPPQSLHSILDADSTQRECIIAAREGKSFVMDGPPGSGKSQTIANIIAELMATGRSVLFVSEKAAALDVVKKRLDQAFLGEFVLELHSHQASRKEVAQALGGAVARRVKPTNSSSPSVSALEKRREQLSSYAQALNELRPEINATLHDVIGRCGALGDSPLANPPSDIQAAVGDGNLERILEHSRALAAAWGPIERGEDFLWRDSSDAMALTTRTKVEAELEELSRKFDQLRDAAQAFSDSTESGRVLDLDDCSFAAELSALLEVRRIIPDSWLTSTDSEFEHLGKSLNRLQVISGSRKELVAQLERHSERWQTLPNSRVDVSKSLSDLERLIGGSQCSTWTQTEIRSHISHADAALVALRTTKRESARLAESFGVANSQLGLATAKRLLELVSLMDSSNRPERSWLDVMVLQKARDAIKLVRPLVDQWRLLESQVLEVFNDGIRTVEIESLYENEKDVQLKVGILSPRGRANKKTIQAISKTGKATPDVLAAVQVARTWQALTRRLAELHDAEVLGSYFDGPQTDLAAVDGAVDVAERVLKLAGSGADTAALASRVSRGAIDRDGLQDSGVRLSEALQTWERELLAVSGASPKIGTDLPFDSAEAAVRELGASLRRVVEVVEPFWSSEGSTLASCVRLASARQMESEIQAEFRELSEPLVLGPDFVDFETEWSLLINGYEWAASVRELLESQIEAGRARELLHANPNPRVGELLSDVHHRIALLTGLFTSERAAWIGAEMGGRIEDAIELVQVLRDTLDDVEEWKRYSQSVSGLKSLGMSDAVDFVIREQLDRALIEELFERTVLRSWVDLTIASDPRCALARAIDRDALVREFRELDAGLASAAAARVIEVCNERRPVSHVGEPAILKTEAEKGRKHRPVRDLLAATMQTSQDVKPCFMMSPLAVSQFLPSTMRFDVVIFDEASQVRPCDAINAVYRGNQLIVAGDERQLPPTSFFDTGFSDESDAYDEDDTVEFESVLKLAKGAAGIDELPLRWHYRSRHESLITFSNRVFYRSELVTYPGAVDKSDHLGVEFIHVPEGVYARGGSRDNRTEAEKVVERVEFFASKYPKLTLGVVAFSAAQADRITVEIEALRRERPDLDRYFAEDRLDGFFVKNLESVQGDERDVIIFSIGYGRDENGKLTMAFGPLNKDGGHRRLNVAVTRARQRVEVVSSITASDFDVHATNFGVNCLRRYLDFAARGMLAFADDQTQGGEPESPFEIDVLQCIEEMGFDVVSQVGQAGYRIDMAVRHPDQPGRYVLGIECDGAMYHSSRVARDRDRLRQEVLEGLGWKLHRIWGTSWYRQREVEKVRLREAIEAAIDGRQPAGTEEPDRPAVVKRPTIVEVEEAVGAQWTNFYAPYITPVRPRLDFNAADIAPQLIEIVRAIIRETAPVHPDAIVDTVKRVGGVERMGSQRREKVESAISRLQSRRDIVKDRFGFYWLAGVQEVVVRVPTPGDELTDRGANLVSPDEIKLAMFHLAKDARSITVVDLRLKIARLFGWKRTGVDIDALLTKAFKELVKAGSLIIISGKGDEALVRAWDEDLPDLS